MQRRSERSAQRSARLRRGSSLQGDRPRSHLPVARPRLRPEGRGEWFVPRARNESLDEHLRSSNRGVTMPPEQFCYWLQGKFEGRDIKELPAEEVAEVRKHLDLVFTHAPKASRERYAP